MSFFYIMWKSKESPSVLVTVSCLMKVALVQLFPEFLRDLSPFECFFLSLDLVCIFIFYW